MDEADLSLIIIGLLLLGLARVIYYMHNAKVTKESSSVNHDLPLHTPSEERRRLIYGLLKLCEKVNIGGNRASGYGEITIKAGSK